MPTVWIDADAAPRACKDVLFRASERRGLSLVLVANRAQRTPRSARVRMVVVGQGFDVADEYIAEQVGAGDLVITNDVPLAAAVIERGATVIRPRGEELTEANVQQRLAVRDIMDELRGGGEALMGGPPPYSDKDKQRFANALDRWITKHR
jgi:uncharacterized protein YaiI (UPF0178 family)